VRQRERYPEESCESLYEDAPCGFFSTLPDGTLIRINRTMQALTGYEPEQLETLRFIDLLTMGGKIFYETHYAPLLAMQGSVSEIAVDIVRADGSIFAALINSVLHRDEEGRPRVIRTVLIGATDRRSYERELLAARQRADLVAKTRTDFVAMLSHDIRTPLSAVVSVAEALETSDLSDVQKGYVRLLRRGTDNLMALVNDVLDNTKLASGKMKLESRALHLGALLGELIDGMRVVARGKGLQLWVTIDPRIPRELVGDPVKVGQIFTNLIGNAIKFTDKGWVGVTVDMTSQADREIGLTVTITDTGIGIDPAHLGDLFDDFRQVHEQTGRDFGGTGLGLAISKRLIELHGGRIIVKRRPLCGTIFEFTLPLRLPS